MEFDPETLFSCVSMSLPLHASHDAMDIAAQSRGSLDQRQSSNFPLPVSKNVSEVNCLFFISDPSADIFCC